MSENGCQTDGVVQGGLPYPALHLLALPWQALHCKAWKSLFGPVFILMGDFFVVLVQVQPS